MCLGGDIVLESGRKYLGGDSDVVGGLVVVKNGELGEEVEFVEK
ncbi:PLP-dependent transferase [Bacillus mycoides]